jgi:hypothetical protein
MNQVLNIVSRHFEPVGGRGEVDVRYSRSRQQNSEGDIAMLLPCQTVYLATLQPLKLLPTHPSVCGAIKDGTRPRSEFHAA